MSYGKQFPIRITIGADDYELLIKTLKANENDFTGHISKGAKALREKIEKYGRRESGENGGEVVRLGFYENEGVMFIWQFLAASNITEEYRDLMKTSDKCAVE